MSVEPSNPIKHNDKAKSEKSLEVQLARFSQKSHDTKIKETDIDAYLEINAISFKQSFFKLQTNYHQENQNSKNSL